MEKAYDFCSVCKHEHKEADGSCACGCTVGAVARMVNTTVEAGK